MTFPSPPVSRAADGGAAYVPTNDPLISALYGALTAAAGADSFRLEPGKGWSWDRACYLRKA